MWTISMINFKSVDIIINEKGSFTYMSLGNKKIMIIIIINALKKNAKIIWLMLACCMQFSTVVEMFLMQK